LERERLPTYSISGFNHRTGEPGRLDSQRCSESTQARADDHNVDRRWRSGTGDDIGGRNHLLELVEWLFG
jgi:hypothetical protein